MAIQDQPYLLMLPSQYYRVMLIKVNNNYRGNLILLLLILV